MTWSAAQQRYSKSSLGKTARRKYQMSEKGRAARRAYLARRKARLTEVNRKQAEEVKPVKNEPKVDKIKREVASKK